MSVTGLGALEKTETKQGGVKSRYGQALEHNSAMNLHLPPRCQGGLGGVWGPGLETLFPGPGAHSPLQQLSPGSALCPAPLPVGCWLATLLGGAGGHYQHPSFAFTAPGRTKGRK